MRRNLFIWRCCCCCRCLWPWQRTQHKRVSQSRFYCIVTQIHFMQLHLNLISKQCWWILRVFLVYVYNQTYNPIFILSQMINLMNEQNTTRNNYIGFERRVHNIWNRGMQSCGWKELYGSLLCCGWWMTISFGSARWVVNVEAEGSGYGWWIFFIKNLITCYDRT